MVPVTPSISSSPVSPVTDASSFTLTCGTTSTGLSSPMYVWTIDSTDQSPQSAATLVQTADINSVSEYKCKVSGNGGTDYSAESIAYMPTGK